MQFKYASTFFTFSMRLRPFTCQQGSTLLLFLLSLPNITNALVRRVSACPAQTTSASAHRTSPKATPKPSCDLQNEDPDQGINARGCICGTKTLPLLTLHSAADESQSCSYTAFPSSKVQDPISIETQYYTHNCQACTLVGGIADMAKCTSVAKCKPTLTAKPASKTSAPAAKGTFTVWLSNNSVPIGDENDKNKGADLRTTMFSKLQALCPNGASECDSTKNAAIDNIPTVVDDNPMDETLAFTIQDSAYDSTDNRDRMLAAAVATWQQATAKSCKEVTYEADADQAASAGCGQGPVKRDLRELARLGAVKKRELDTRAECQGTAECIPPPKKCTYTATVCSSPDHISKFNPYSPPSSLGRFCD